MGRTSKNDNSGGDERNIYVRRYKSTSYSSKASSSNVTLANRESESESSNRSKYSGSITKPQGVGKNNLQSKLRTPVNTGLGQPMNRLNRNNILSTNKEVKNTGGATKTKSQMTKMKQESENLERKQKSQSVPTDNKETTEENHTEEQPSVQQENGNTNGTIVEKDTTSEGSNNETKENGKTEQNGDEVPQTNEKEEEDFDLQLEAEENCVKSEQDTTKDSSEASKEEETQNESKTSVEEVQEDSQTNTESCSVDVVESTTSEVTESTEPLETKNNDNENQEVNTEVSYDSNIMLKDVKIKLNDCLKETKVEEENDVDESQPTYAHKEATFGKTLRTISGRSSIDRMKHITIRDRQPSPNSSMFVNTSSVSISEDGTSDYKILRHRKTLSELSSSNGGIPLDRKRKLIEQTSSPLKKPKTEESSGLLNTSFELLKYPFGLRRPVKVSTPYKFEPEKQNASISEEVKVNDEPGYINKWCVLM